MSVEMEKIHLSLQAFNRSLKDKGLYTEPKKQPVVIAGDPKITSAIINIRMPSDEELAEKIKRLQSEKKGE